MLLERRHANHCVVAPVWSAIGLPPGAAHGPGAQAEAHAELEDPREGARRGHADHEALQDAEPRIDLHDADQTQDACGGHKAVGIERHHQVVPVAPALEEIADVAGLEAGVGLAPPVGDRKAALPLFLCRRNIGPAGVAQHIDVEAVRHARCIETRYHGREIAHHPLGPLVAHARHDRRRRHDRGQRLRPRRLRHHHGARIAGEPHNAEADGGVPEADGQPRRGHAEQHQQQEIDDPEAARRQRQDGKNEE